MSDRLSTETHDDCLEHHRAICLRRINSVATVFRIHTTDIREL